MNRETNFNIAKSIMGANFIGFDELKKFGPKDFKLDRKNDMVPFSVDELNVKKDNYVLIYGANSFVDGTAVTIKNLKEIMSKQSDCPVFYNQDWYDQEGFINEKLPEGWFLIRKNVYEDSRAVMPEILIKRYVFPSAIKCTYAFFVAWLCIGVKLWYEDFIWCSDVDHNGDRIYVGKYHDVDGINNDGFSIHRHLALRNCYTCID